jgi:5-methyltetrahydrofolate--homocysteine methyltransferase
MDELATQKSTGATPPGWGRGRSGRQPSRRTPRRATTTAPGRRSDVRTDVPVPIPPFWGSRVHRGVPLDALLPLLNTTALFRNQWGFGRDDTADADAALRSTLELVRTESLLAPQVVYGYFACNGDGDDVVIYDAPDSATVVARWSFPRQSGERRLCIADFFRPVGSGERDVLALQCVTMGDRVSARAAELFAADRYTDYLFLHGLGVECAEALAEHWHARIRAELGIADADAATPRELFRQGYQGSRYSFGYAACPDLELRAPLIELLAAERIGVELSESFQLHPEQSTDAFIVHHPQARYFNAR